MSKKKEYPQIYTIPFMIGAVIFAIGIGITFGIGASIITVGIFVMLLSIHDPEEDDE